jgi:ABC-2 type transport system permease protein
MMAPAAGFEWLKLRRSRLSLITLILVALGCPALTAGFMAAAAHGPSDTSLAIKINAILVGDGWTAYLGMLTQILSVAAVLGAGLVVSWSFGREFSDHSLGSLFALPTSLIEIASAKFVVLVGWTLALSGLALIAAFALAPLAGLHMPVDAAAGAIVKVVLVGLTGGLLAFPLAFVATAARGHLPAVAFLILIVVVTQILTVVGVGGWFPYAAISLWSGMGGAAAAAQITAPQLLLVPLTGAIGCIATIGWWRHMQVV